MAAVLITGASRGVGRATALRLAAGGWQVFAGVRRAEDGEALAAASGGITPVLLDVTDPEQVATIERALTAPRPRARYVPGAGPRAQAAAGPRHARPGARRRPGSRQRHSAPG